MIPQKDLSVLQFLNFVGQMTRDNGLIEAPRSPPIEAHTVSAIIYENHFDGITQPCYVHVKKIKVFQNLFDV